MIEHQPNWDEHILIVFSVLAGLAFTESFSQLSLKGFGITESILTFLVFYVVMDNWYWLHKDLVIIDVTSSIEVVLYLLSVVSYSCVPYMFGTKSNAVVGVGAAEWMMINLAIICFIDATRKTASLIKLHNLSLEGYEENEKKLIGRFVFFVITGFCYTIFLIIATAYSVKCTSPAEFKATLVVLIWIAIRIIDLIVMPKISYWVTNVFLERK